MGAVLIENSSFRKNQLNDFTFGYIEVVLEPEKTVVLKNEKLRNMSGYIPTTDLDQISIFETLRKNTRKYVTELSMHNKYSLEMNAKWLITAVDKLDDNLLLQ